MLVTLFPAVCAALSLAVLLVVLVRFHKSSGVSASAATQPPREEISIALRDDLSSLASRVASLESEHRESAGGPVRAGINLSKRTQALRQYRQGQTAEVIAKSLDMTKAEVALLLKVQQIVSR